MISEETYNVVQENAETLNSAVIYDRDFNYVCYQLHTSSLPLRV